MPRKPANLDGQRFGKLVVVRTTEMRTGKQNRILYECRCDCGGIHYTTANELKRGKVRSCGCLHHPKIKPGDRFYRLEVLRRVPHTTTGGHSVVKYECLCDCGNRTFVNAQGLTTGQTKSCGCLTKDRVRMLYRDGTAPCKLKESQKPRSTNTSGITGVWWDKAREVWCAEIIFQRNKIYLGRFRNKYDAEDARLEAEEFYFGTYLAEIEEQGNAKLHRKNRANTTGIIGVYREKNNKWVASIKHRNKAHFLGCYDTTEAATIVRHAANTAKRRGIFEEWFQKYKETGEIKVPRPPKKDLHKHP